MLLFIAASVQTSDINCEVRLWERECCCLYRNPLDLRLTLTNDNYFGGYLQQVMKVVKSIPSDTRYICWRKEATCELSSRKLNQLHPYNQTIFNTLRRPRQNGRHFRDDILKWFVVDVNAWISIKISLKFVSRGPNNNMPALVHMAIWRLLGDKPWFEPIMAQVIDTYMRQSASMNYRYVSSSLPMEKCNIVSK